MDDSANYSVRFDKNIADETTLKVTAGNYCMTLEYLHTNMYLHICDQTCNNEIIDKTTDFFYVI